MARLPSEKGSPCFFCVHLLAVLFLLLLCTPSCWTQQHFAEGDDTSTPRTRFNREQEWEHKPDIVLMNGTTSFGAESPNDTEANVTMATVRLGGVDFSLCPSSTCAERCSPYTPHPQNISYTCSCDSLCVHVGDCCPDYLLLCHDAANDSQAIDVITDVFSAAGHPGTEDEPNTAYYAGLYSDCVDTGNVSYTMVSTCPADFSNETVRSLCEIIPSVFAVTPHVSHAKTPQLTFKNARCAECHRINDGDVISWKTQLYCDDVGTSATAREIGQAYQSGKCHFQYTPPTEAQPRQCFAAQSFGPHSFQQFGKLDSVRQTASSASSVSRRWCDDDDMLLCRTYTHPVFCTTRYQNPHCMKCIAGHAPPVVTDVCGDTDIRARPGYAGADESMKVPSITSKGIVALFDIQEDAAGIEIGGEFVPWQKLQCTDNEVFDHYTLTCRRIVCPQGQVTSNGNCVPGDVVVAGDTQLLPSGTDRLTLVVVQSEDVNCKDSALSLKRYFPKALDISCNVETGDQKVPAELAITLSISDGFQKMTEIERRFAFDENVRDVSMHNADADKLNSSCGTGYQRAVKHDVEIDNTEGGPFAVVLQNGGKVMYPFKNIPFEVILQRDGSVSGNMNSAITVTLCVETSTLNCTTDAVSYSRNETRVVNGTLRVEGTDLVFAQDEYEVHGDGFSACPPFKSYSDWLGKLKLLQFKPEQMIAVYALTGISVLSLIFVLAAYVFVPELRTLPGKMTASLVACLLAGHILLNVPWPSDTSRARDMACRLIGCVSHFSWLSVFVWMSALAFHMARTFYSPAANQMSRNEADKAFRKYSRLCWGLPVVFVLVCFALDFTPGHGLTTDYGKDMCGWMGPRAVMFVFLIPAALSLALNFACIAAAVVGIEKTAQASSMAGSRRSECQRLVIYAKMACALGLPWLLGLGVSFTDWEWLWWTYAAVNSLQGTFIAWAFVVNQRLVRTLKRKFGRQAETSDTKTSSAWSTVSKPVALSEIPANKL